MTVSAVPRQRIQTQRGTLSPPSLVQSANRFVSPLNCIRLRATTSAAKYWHVAAASVCCVSALQGCFSVPGVFLGSMQLLQYVSGFHHTSCVQNLTRPRTTSGFGFQVSILLSTPHIYSPLLPIQNNVEAFVERGFGNHCIIANFKGRICDIDCHPLNYSGFSNFHHILVYVHIQGGQV